MKTEPISYRGVWPAMVTPLTAALDVDTPKFAAHARHLIACGCVGVTPFGTTGEGPSFSVAERRLAIEGLITHGVPAERIVVSASCAALPDALDLTRHAVEVGAYGVLLMPPFFLKNVSDQGVIDAYRWLIDQVADERLRLVLYHIPQVSGVAVSQTVIETLRDLYPRTIIGVKDSSCQREDSLRYGRAFMPALQVWVGNEPDLPAMGQLGSLGAISGFANIVPRLIGRLAVAQGDDDPAAQADIRRLHDFAAILQGLSLTPAFKGMLAHLTQDDGWRRVRAPLVALDDAAIARIATQMQAFGLTDHD